MKKIGKTLFTTALYLIAFLCIQLGTSIIGSLIWPDFLHNATAMIIVFGVGAVLTIVLFAVCRWSPIDRNYLRSGPWVVLFWVVVLALGTLIPSMALEEWLGVDLPEHYKQMFTQLMSRREGYFVVGLLVPLAEEMVFRGALLRLLLQSFPERWHWMPIALSAILFAVAHGNEAQMLHAFLLGLLLGWLYYRTGSIVPSLVLHWVNNTVAYAVTNIMPQWNDASLTDVFQSQRNAMLAVLFSLMICLPAAWQIAHFTEKNHRKTPEL